MTKTAILNPNQPALPFSGEIVPVRPHEEIDWERRLTLRRLIWVRAAEEQIGADYAAPPDFTAAEPVAIEAGLYIPQDDPRHRNAEGIIEVNPRFITEAAKQAPVDLREGRQPKVPPASIGVIFPPDEFKRIGKYPKALARHMRTNTREANKTEPDRDEVDEKVGRSAGHILENYIKGMNGLQNELLDERSLLMSLFKDLGQPVWRAHFKAKNLERRRKQADELIHETAEVSTININLGTTAIEGMHRAIKANLYGGHLSQADLVKQWQRYLVLTGRYTTARIDRVTSATAVCQAELAQFQPFLDRKQSA